METSTVLFLVPLKRSAQMQRSRVTLISRQLLNLPSAIKLTSQDLCATAACRIWCAHRMLSWMVRSSRVNMMILSRQRQRICSYLLSSCSLRPFPSISCSEKRCSRLRRQPSLRHCVAYLPDSQYVSWAHWFRYFLL